MEFNMDKFKAQAMQVAKAARKTAVAMADTGKNQAKLLDAQSKLAKAERQLGQLVYSLQKSGELDMELIQKYVESYGFSVVRDFVGHGVGMKLHEAPEVPNFGPAGHGPRLQPGMTIAVEPMVCAGDWRVKVLKDKWTTVTVDGSLAAHYENTILITDGEPEVLTDPGE